MPTVSVTSTGPRNAPPLQPGERIGGKYRVQRLLGQGGMGAVYLVTHEALESVFALKVLSRGSEMHQARFVREGRILASLRSEHVAKAVDFGVIEEFGAPYMVMEYLPGADLSAHLEASAQPLPVRDAVDHVLEACEALAEAHREGIIHRDVKPSNLFLTTRIDGWPMVKVLDFGIAKTEAVGNESSLTATEMVFGSPAYMSPEQVRSSKTVGPQTDVWSMALVLYELVSKRHPFQGDSPAGVVAAIAADPPRPLPAEIGPDLWSAIEPALRKDPAQRPQTIASFAASLAGFAGERGRIVLARIERMGATDASASQATRAMVSTRPLPPAAVPTRPSSALAVPDEPLQASARTTFGPATRAPVSRLGTLGLALGGLAIVAVGAALGLRAQSLRAAAPPLPVNLVASAASAALEVPAVQVGPAPAAASSAVAVSASVPSGVSQPSKTHRPAAKPPRGRSQTPPRQSEFD